MTFKDSALTGQNAPRQNVPELVKTSPSTQKVGQNVPIILNATVFIDKSFDE